jgi:hypothetical protein
MSAQVLSANLRDRIAGSVLLAIALVWVVLIVMTVEPSQGTTAGARAFPLFFGIALAGLSLIMLLRSFMPRAEPEPAVVLSAPNESFAVVSTIGAIVLYGAMLEPLGFIPSTALIVAAIMIVVLRIRAPLIVTAMALGLSLGCYLVFGKLLGTYLPPGTWITIYL